MGAYLVTELKKLTACLPHASHFLTSVRLAAMGTLAVRLTVLPAGRTNSNAALSGGVPDETLL
jgi:hypothetical protein